MANYGWHCSKCTFFHKLPRPRCAMCGELKGATREQMRDFVLGKTVASSKTESEKNGVSGREVSSSQDTTSTMPARRSTVRNPYLAAKKSSISSHSTANTTTATDSNHSKDDDEWQHHVNATTFHSSAATRAVHPPAPPQQSPNTNLHPTHPLPSVPRNPYPSTSSKTGQIATPAPARTEPSILHLPSTKPSKPPPSTNALDQLRDISQSSRKSSNSKRQTKDTPIKARPYSPGPVPLDQNKADTWIYPEHPDYPTRQYQHEIAETAVQYNTLVSLPTGLGKTLIAAVVMYNYWRWFPTGKVIFLAPTLPLVNQQVHACYKIMGIPANDTAVMTGKTGPEKRLDHWHYRRVFYCTPQTVQKDLAAAAAATEQTMANDDHSSSTTCTFAKQVVCLVLDEAHKATGDYAYVKVIEQLEEAGAKFRILGLSATPGTSIKAIQQVVQALRICKIEARHELDPSVQPYLHEKFSEVVIVPRNDCQRQVERHLSNMLGPHLEQLRLAGAIRINGNATLTPFGVLQAKRDFLAKSHGPPPGILLGHYGVVHKIVELRNDAHQSLGVVRAKLLRLRNEPQRGMLSTLVKSPAFAILLEMVLSATNPSPSDDYHNGYDGFSQRQASPKNNPKLIKLSELLQEHFCRSQACGKSSRVIVFSQFRDSVSEIVMLLRTLEPSIRPHHFIGQGKPPKVVAQTKKKTDSHTGAATTGGNDHNTKGMIRLRGMTQSEQQQVIQQFRSDVYNVLVCTCIGEEGLDIGEVDLIVNYDTLRSPIRMIQRTGRTGRQRNGRVVCLIAEGQEQRTYEQSKQAEKTLMRALAKKSNFTMAAHTHLLPAPPQKQTAIMNIASQLHWSQVAGGDNAGSIFSKGPSKSKKYKLDAPQEEERQQRFGDLAPITTNDIPWKTLRRVFIRNRSDRMNFGGRTVSMLRALESFGSTHYALIGAKASRSNVQISRVFPVEKTPREKKNPSNTSSGVDSNNTCSKIDEAHSNLRVVLPQRTEPPPDQVSEEVHTDSPTQEPNGNVNGVISNSTSAMPSLHKRTVPPNEVTETAMHIDSLPPISNDGPIFRLPTPPPSSSDEDSDEEQSDAIHNPLLDQQESKVISKVSIEARPDAGPIEILDCSQELASERQCLQRSVSLQNHTNTSSSMAKAEGPDDHNDEFKFSQTNLQQRLQTGSEPPASHLPIIDPAAGNAGTPNESEEDIPLIALRTKTKRKPPSSIHVTANGSQQSNATANSAQSWSSFPSIVTKKSEKRRKFVIEDGNSQSQQSELGNLDTVNETVSAKAAQTLSPHIEQELNLTQSPPSPDIVLKRPKKMRKYVIDDGLSQSPNHVFESSPQQTGPKGQPLAANSLQDTPTNKVFQKPNSSTPVGLSSAAGLTDTPTTPAFQEHGRRNGITDPQALACSVCLGCDSLDSDPIVICDGCDQGFHKRCYAIEINLDSPDPWYCDVCSNSTDKVMSCERQCALCANHSGAMKRLAENTWCHAVCQPFVGTETLPSKRCLYCSQEGGIQCFSCTKTIHPYCALNEPQEGLWTVVLLQASTQGGAALFCPAHIDSVHAFISDHCNDSQSTDLPRIKMIQTRQVIRTEPRQQQLKKLRRVQLPSASVERIDVPNPAAREPHSKLVARQKMRLAMSRFVLEEVEIGSDDDAEGDGCEDEELRQLEEDEMSRNSFINDSLELTQYYSQDNLAGIDPDANEEIDFQHRALDAERERENQFRTPLLNRRMRRPETSPLTSSSQKGLGNLHFVRSVLEHHRQGGRAEEIEAFYHQIAIEEANKEKPAETAAAES